MRSTCMKYTPGFRGQAARLVIETDRPVAHVAVETSELLARRVLLAREAASARDADVVLGADERAELQRLRLPGGPLFGVDPLLTRG